MGKKQRAGAYSMARSDRDLEALLQRYLDQDSDAFDAVTAMSTRDPEQCWRFLEIARRADLSDEQLAFLSAGPFEEMMKRHGEDFIGRVEIAARDDARMRTLLATVWRAGMNDALWGRVLALRGSLGIDPL